MGVQQAVRLAQSPPGFLTRNTACLLAKIACCLRRFVMSEESIYTDMRNLHPTTVSAAATVFPTATVSFTILTTDDA